MADPDNAAAGAVATTTVAAASAATPLTADQQAQLQALLAQQQAAAAAAASAAQKAQLAALAPVGAALGSADAISSMIAALKAVDTDLDDVTSARVARLCLILNNDALSIFAQIKALGG